mmetsp:Transcript_58072/g.85113  ORF Transcript_58072/g.85113 Transcript_58072/m.85113 type:complete len:150 (-) Transcript_58072:21-470(-)
MCATSSLCASSTSVSALTHPHTRGDTHTQGTALIDVAGLKEAAQDASVKEPLHVAPFATHTHARKTLADVAELKEAVHVAPCCSPRMQRYAPTTRCPAAALTTPPPRACYRRQQTHCNTLQARCKHTASTLQALCKRTATRCKHTTNTL